MILSNRPRGTLAPALLAASLLLLASPDLADDSRRTDRGRYLTVIHLGNEGVWIDAPSGGIVIDGLFGEGLTGYETVPARERKRLERAAPPYDEARLLLATHHHGDHFDAAAVASHLSANPEAIFFSTGRAVAELRALGEASAERARSAEPEAGATIEMSLGFAELRVLKISHGAFDPPVTNLGFLIEVDGLKLLHIGDSEARLEDFEAYDLAGERIDVAFVPFWYMLDDEGRAAIRDGIRARTVIPVHVPAEGAPASYFGGPGGRAELLRAMENAVPGLTAFQRPLRTRRFAVPSSSTSSEQGLAPD
jgi:L-ascorbate metabolism protein UlaG (beta-lactamase superfamily)